LEFNVHFQHKYGYIRDELDLDGLKMNQCAKYVGCRSFSS